MDVDRAAQLRDRAKVSTVLIIIIVLMSISNVIIIGTASLITIAVYIAVSLPSGL